MKVSKTILTTIAVFLVIAASLMPKGALAITIQEEEELAREFMKVVLTRYKLIDDYLIVNYVNEIGNKIVTVLPPQPFTYHFYVIQEDVYNAFATPAGHIFINSGLLAVMENEDELAGIISHEVAHVTCRHISQKIERSQKIGMATLAGVVAGIFLGVGGATAAANAVTFGSVAAGQSAALAYSRDDESQADKIGMDILNQAGYSGYGLLSVLKKIRNKQWFGSEQIPTYLMTHPAVEDRMAYIDTWLERHKSVPVNLENYDFARAHTRLVAVYGDPSMALQGFQQSVKNDPGNPLAHYGYGLVLDRTGNRKAAIHHLKVALEKRAFDPYFLKDLGRLYFLDGQYLEALDVLESTRILGLYDPEGLYYLGRTQMALDHHLDAVTAFQEILVKNMHYPQALFSLGEAYDRLGKPGEAHYYLGLFYMQKANPKNAVFHLKKALDNVSDPEKKAKIEAILEELRKKG